MSTAIDTETIDGYARLLCSPSRHFFVNNWDDCVRALYLISQTEGRKAWTFNLRYDIQAMIKYLPEDVLKEIYETNKYDFGDYNLFYLPKKMFSLSWGKGVNRKLTICDAMQFFGSGSLDTNSKEYLKQEKMTSPIIETFKHQEKLTPEFLTEYLADNEKEIVKYCKHDAFLTVSLGQLIESTQQKIYGLHIETYSSNAKIGEVMTITWMRKHHQEYPHPNTQSHLSFPQPYNLHPMAEATCRGGWFETWQCGTFGEVTDIDINSAYPWNMKDLPHWNNGEFVWIDEEKDLLPTDFYGWIFSEFDCQYIPFNTRKEETWTETIAGTEIKMRGKKKVEIIINPKGKRAQEIILAEYLFMKKHKFKCKFLGGWVWRQTQSNWVNPFGWIPAVMKQKEEIKKALKAQGLKNSMEYLMVKIAPNGTSGKTHQAVGNFKPLYSPFYFSYITGLTRLRIADFILSNNLIDKVINVATDGVLLDGNIDIKSSSDFGGFEVNHYPSAFVIGNGMLQIFTSRPDKPFFSKARGIDKSGVLNLRQICEDNKDKGNVIPEKRLRPMHLGECIQHKKILSLKDLNRFKEVGRSLAIDSDSKRKWDISCFGDLIDQRHRGHVLDVKDYVL